MADSLRAPSSEAPGQEPARLFSIDALRGLIMVLMALDHANYFIAQKHPTSEIWDGVYPIYYDSTTFLTRFVTHFAAPGFFLLMGAGIALFAARRMEKGWNRRTISQRLALRGAILMVLQVLVVDPAWGLSPGGWGIRIYIGVLFALGGAMILSSLLVWLRSGWLAGIASALFVGTELLHPGLGMWSQVSHRPLEVMLVYPGGTETLWSYYPILPWLELAVLGMALGKWLQSAPLRTYAWLWRIGLTMLAGFVLIRALDGFGNIRPRLGNGWMDWLSPVKYPPSMAYTLMTTGANLMLLYGFSRAGDRARRLLSPLTVLGREPLFFYIIHLYLYALLGRIFAPQGSSIQTMYPFWLLGLLTLFPLCLWYGRWRQNLPARAVGRLL